MVTVAEVLLIFLACIFMMSGLTEEAELSEVLLLTNILVTFLPTSFPLQEEANSVRETFKGGYRTSYLGSCSKHNIISGVVRL